jgi:hypothetical protein
MPCNLRRPMFLDLLSLKRHMSILILLKSTNLAIQKFCYLTL